MRKNSRDGNALLIMLVMMVVVSFGAMSLLQSAGIYQTASIRNFGQQQSYYMADSTRSFAVQAASQYLAGTNTPTNEGLTEALKVALEPIMPDDYEITNISAEILSTKTNSAIPSGPFKGIESPQSDIKLKYRVSLKGQTDRQYVSDVEAVLSLAEVSLFQFLYFSDLHQTYFTPGAPTLAKGHFHANGNLCYSSGDTGISMIGKITASGRLMHSNHSFCNPYRTKYPTTHTRIANTPDFSSSVLFGGMPATNHEFPQSGCRNCNYNAGQLWLDFSLNYYRGQVMDGSHAVPRLSLPVPQKIAAQVGADGVEEFTGRSNQKNLRFTIDPILPSDTKEIRDQKYAHKADIRIIDGVWYLRDIKNVNLWPGIPIWSDHPGEFTDKWGNKVGQRELRVLHDWDAGAGMPRRYSYYEYREDMKALNIESGDDRYGTVSYGTLARLSTLSSSAAGEGLGIFPHWKPGQILARPASGTTAYNNRGGGFNYSISTININSMCSNPQITPGRPVYPGAVVVDAPVHSDGVATSPVLPTAAVDRGEVLLPFTSAVECQTGGVRPTPFQPNRSSSILNSTRSGIHDPHLHFYNTITYSDYPIPALSAKYRSHILPVNFDMEQFQLALGDNARKGELGWFFAQHPTQKRAFNGIVYLSSSWPGSDKGFAPEGLPDPQPTLNDGIYDGPSETAYIPSSLGDTSQIDLTHPQQIRTLPIHLCTQSADLIGTNFDETAGPSGGSGVARFAIPDCGKYPNEIKSYPNAIRIFNGQKISKSVLPNGISVVSNLPVYIQGDFNKNSDQKIANNPLWVPALVAGDQITTLSNGWDDLNGLFTTQMRASNVSGYRLIGPIPKRKALPTIYNLALMAGWAMHESRNIRDTTVGGNTQGMHSFPALMEDWLERRFELNGSLIIGFHPVFNRSGRYFSDANWASDSSNGDFNSIPSGTYRSGPRTIEHDKNFKLPRQQPPGTPSFPISAIKSWRINQD